MIRLSGYETDQDIPISIIGSGGDEKLFEDILTVEEGTAATRHKQIFIVKLSSGLCS
jgi:FlaA1/EpsC-like NDP-sugar epimerase